VLSITAATPVGKTPSVFSSTGFNSVVSVLPTNRIRAVPLAASHSTIPPLMSSSAVLHSDRPSSKGAAQSPAMSPSSSYSVLTTLALLVSELLWFGDADDDGR